MARFYITTPIFYVNDAPHVGHAYCTVNADALARFHRLDGDETFFLTGTDEHGQKVADAAEKNDMSPQAWTDQTSQRFRDAWDGLDISYDDFIRTTEPRHATTVQAFLQKIYDNGFIYKGTYEGLYCVSCEDYFVADALVDGNCPVHGRPVTHMAEENWFFRLSAFGDQLLEYYQQHPQFTTPDTKRNEAVSFIREGLKDISITRTSLSWGVPVPWDSEQVFYVWYDALVNYLTALDYGQSTSRMDEWWPRSHHLIGKEIIRFHCVWWPAMCLAAGIEPPAHVQVHGWLLVGGQKLSKTMAGEGSVRLSEIAPSALVGEFGTDPLRYYLLRETALGNDGDFSIEGIIARYNTDLANNLGNLVARVAAVVTSKCDGIGAAPVATSVLATSATSLVAEAHDAWTTFAPQRALEATWRLIGAANSHLESHAPWKMEPGAEVAAVMAEALEVIRIVAIMIVPAMPTTAQEIWRRIGMAGSVADETWGSTSWGGYPGGHAVIKGEALFPRIRTDA
ncbi:MAG: methionine--tRNA ligase [Actinomycetota bacterium]